MKLLMMKLLMMKTTMKNIFKFNQLTMTKTTYSLTQESIINIGPIFSMACVYMTLLALYIRKR